MALDPRSFIRDYLNDDQRRIPETTAPTPQITQRKPNTLQSLGVFGSLVDSAKNLYQSLTGNDPAEQAKQAAIDLAKKVASKGLLGTTKVATPMREATDAELAPLGLSRQEVRSNASEAVVRAQEDATRIRNQGMTAEFDYYNTTPAERAGALLTVPIRWTIGSLSRFTVGAIGALTDTDISYTPVTKLEEYFWGPQELTSIGKGDDLYSIADQVVSKKLSEIGVAEDIADKLGLSTALLMGAILENPFIGPGKKGAQEAMERTLRDYVEANVIRGTASDELSARITKAATELAQSPVAEREVLTQRFLAEIEAEQSIKKSVQQTRNELLSIRKQYVRNAVETDDAVFKNISEYEQKRLAAQDEVSQLADQGLWKHEYASAIRNTPDWRKEGTVADWMHSGSVMTRDLPNGRKIYMLAKGEDVPTYKAGGWSQTGMTVDTMASQAGFEDPSDYLDFVLKMDDKLTALPEKDPIRMAHNYLLENDPTYANINKQIETAKQQLRDLERQGIAAQSLNATPQAGFDAGSTIETFGEVISEPVRAEAIRISNTAKQISDVTKPPKAKPTEELYAANRVLGADRKQNVADAMERVKTAGYEKGKDILSAITERMENIDPTIKNRFRKMLQDSLLQTQKDGKVAHELFQKVSKASKQDIADIGYAMINGDTEALKTLAERNGFSETVTSVRSMLDDVYKRAQEVGYEFGYEQGYFPRMIKDKEGFIKYMEGDARYGDLIREAIVQEEKISGKLTLEKKAELINSLIRGYKRNGIALAKTGNMKDRAIDVVTPEMMKFYMDPFESLAAYIRKTNELIEGKKFFGGNPTENITDSIGMYTLKLMEEGKITPSQEAELTKILDAYFNQKGPGELVGLVRDGSYLMTIGNPISAISNLADLWYSFYKAGSNPEAALKGIAQSVTGKSVATLEELGFENTLRELSSPSGLSKLLERTMKAVGFDKLDKLGKEATINTLWNKWKTLSNGSLADQSKVRGMLFKWLQDEKFVDKAIADIKVGNVSDDMKFVLFNEISDYAPMTLGEMPVDYLKGGNMRIMYQLKSYTLKQLEVVRRDALRDIFSKDNKARGFKNLMTLASFFMLANASVDELKALLLGRPLSVEDGEVQGDVIKDRLVDNMLKLFGMSKYSTYKLRDADLTGFLTSYLAPPALGLIETAVKDAQKLMDSPDISTDILKINSISNIPIGGKLFYWWVGHGAEKSADQKEENLISQTTREFLRLNEAGDKTGAKDLFQSVIEANPEIEDKLFTNIENEILDLSREEVNLKNRTVDERADIIFRALQKMETKEEKRAYLEDLQNKKILTKSVLKALGLLAQEEQGQGATQ